MSIDEEDGDATDVVPRYEEEFGHDTLPDLRFDIPTERAVQRAVTAAQPRLASGAGPRKRRALPKP